MANKFDATTHFLVPEHTKLSEKETKKVLKKYNTTVDKLPKISIKDPAIVSLDVLKGDVIKVKRQSPTSGEIEFFRCVSE